MSGTDGSAAAGPRTVCVTGAARGIGLAIAESFLRDGERVAVNHRSDRPQTRRLLERLRSEHPGRVLPLRADVRSAEAVRDMFRAIGSAWGRLDVLVNAAGVVRDGLVLTMGEDAWGEVVDTDLSGAYRCSRAAAWLMAARRSGTIVNIASASGIGCPAGQANYAAAKAGLLAFTRSLAKELAPRGVRVNAVAPGFVDTDMLRAMPHEQRERALAAVPLGRAGRAEEIAWAVRFLAGDSAAYITGQCLVVDGGLSA